MVLCNFSLSGANFGKFSQYTVSRLDWVALLLSGANCIDKKKRIESYKFVITKGLFRIHKKYHQ